MEENCFRFYTTPGKAVGDRPSLRVVPATPFITLVNEATTATTGTKTTADIVSRETGSNVFVVRGEIAIDAKPHRERGAVWDGALYAATLAKEAFEREGIRVDGAARNIRSTRRSGAH
jgi:D-alanyl-D-alanine carboxypeptidase/D-alanyl-D-alanine-endopeptidase (penicillin-binding protein 4)